MSHGYDSFLCPEPDCPWGVSFPCVGGCEHGANLATVPVPVVAAIGAHRLWHRRADVRAGLVGLEFREDLNDFVEVERRGTAPRNAGGH